MLMIEKINTYESRRGEERGTLKTIHRIIYRCSICAKMFNSKEETETHDHKDKDDAKKNK
jgi:hypothetical protein